MTCQEMAFIVELVSDVVDMAANGMAILRYLTFDSNFDAKNSNVAKYLAVPLMQIRDKLLLACHIVTHTLMPAVHSAYI